ncbi:MAG: hypothetical protein KY410_10405, partial [Proteobacteria bacterium]|nr:hypothetical protein [Pseudomonadota bacterium]
MKRITTFLLGATLPLACLSSATADDTDLYLTPNTPISAQPLVMFTIDYVPSLTSTVSNCGDASSTSCEAGEYFRASQYDDVKAAIAELGTGKMQRNDLIRLSLLEAFHSLDGQIKAGLMMSHKDGGGCNGPGETNCTNGGYIVSGFKTLGDDPATVDTNEGAANAAAFVEILKSIPDAKGSISHDYQGAEMYFEFFRYLTGQKVYNGRNGWESFNSNGDDDVNLNVEFPAFSWDESILKNVTENEVSTTWYVSPFAAKDCSKVYVINIMKQNATKDADSEAAMEAALTSGGLGVSVPSNGTFEAVVERMRTMDLADGTFGKAGDIAGQQNVLSYFLTEFDNTKTQGYARAGGTGEPLIYTDDPSTIVTALEKVFKEILSVSTTFVAASVPVNVFNRSESLDNVFIALFQVDELAKPFWAGNLKKLKILEDANGIYLADVNGEAAISETDGRINYEALTYWTVGGSLPPPEGEFEVAGKDGRSVARGGAGQKIPGFLSGSPGTSNLDGTARQLFYDPESVINGNATTLLPLNMDDTTATDLQTALGAADTLTAKKLIG